MSFWSDESSKELIKLEPLRQYSWSIEINLSQHPPEPAQANDTPEDFFKYSLKECSKPEYEITVHEHRLVTQYFKYPGQLTWKPINIKLVSNEEDRTSIELILESLSRKSGYRSALELSGSSSQPNHQQISKKNIPDIVLIQYNSSGNIIEKWLLQNCIITNVNYGKLSYSSEDFVEISMTVNYDWALQQDVEINKLSQAYLVLDNLEESIPEFTEAKPKIRKPSKKQPEEPDWRPRPLDTSIKLGDLGMKKSDIKDKNITTINKAGLTLPDPPSPSPPPKPEEFPPARFDEAEGREDISFTDRVQGEQQSGGSDTAKSVPSDFPVPVELSEEVVGSSGRREDGSVDNVETSTAEDYYNGVIEEQQKIVEEQRREAEKAREELNKTKYVNRDEARTKEENTAAIDYQKKSNEVSEAYRRVNNTEASIENARQQREAARAGFQTDWDSTRRESRESQQTEYEKNREQREKEQEAAIRQYLIEKYGPEEAQRKAKEEINERRRRNL